MTDRELLEQAAKAAGIDARRLPDAWPNRFDDDLWNPLTDDGDALHLAVKLNLIVNCIHAKILVEEPVCSRVEIWEELQNDDPYAATRRAIVRAAAEIGKEQK